MRRSLATHISRSHLAIGDDLVDSLGNSVGMIVETEMSQQHSTGEEQCSRVSLILALDIETNVSTAWLENGDVSAHVAAWDDTWTTDEGCCNVGKNTCNC